MKIVGKPNNPYGAKDVNKAREARWYVGRGSLTSSTEYYRIQAAKQGLANNPADWAPGHIVFISAEGSRTGRIPVDKDMIHRGAEIGVYWITDNAYHRNRSFNVGEREIAKELFALGYHETSGPTPASSLWIR